MQHPEQMIETLHHGTTQIDIGQASVRGTVGQSPSRRQARPIGGWHACR